LSHHRGRVPEGAPGADRLPVLPGLPELDGCRCPEGAGHTERHASHRSGPVQSRVGPPRRATAQPADRGPRGRRVRRERSTSGDARVPPATRVPGASSGTPGRTRRGLVSRCGRGAQRRSNTASPGPRVESPRPEPANERRPAPAARRRTHRKSNGTGIKGCCSSPRPLDDRLRGGVAKAAVSRAHIVGAAARRLTTGTRRQRCDARTPFQLRRGLPGMEGFMPQAATRLISTRSTRIPGLLPIGFIDDATQLR